MSTAGEINFKARAAWPIVDSLREKFADALNERVREVFDKLPFAPPRRKIVRPFSRLPGVRGRRLALKTRRAWAPRVFGVDWSRGSDRSVLTVRRGSEILSVTEIDAALFDPNRRGGA